MLLHNIEKVKRLKKYLIWYGKLLEGGVMTLDFIQAFMKDDKTIKDNLTEIYEQVHNKYTRNDAIRVCIKVITNEILGHIKELSLDLDKHADVTEFKVDLDQKDISEVINFTISESNIDKNVAYIMKDKALKEYTNEVLKRNIEPYISQVTNDTRFTAYDIFNKLSKYEFNLEMDLPAIKRVLDSRMALVDVVLAGDKMLDVKVDLEVEPVKNSYSFDLTSIISTVPVVNAPYSDIMVEMVNSMYKTKDALTAYASYLESVNKYVTVTKLKTKDDILANLTNMLEKAKNNELTTTEYYEEIEKFFKVISIVLETSILLETEFYNYRNKFKELVNVLNVEYKLANIVLDRISKFIPTEVSNGKSE